MRASAISPDTRSKLNFPSCGSTDSHATGKSTVFSPMATRRGKLSFRSANVDALEFPSWPARMRNGLPSTSSAGRCAPTPIEGRPASFLFSARADPQSPSAIPKTITMPRRRSMAGDLTRDRTNSAIAIRGGRGLEQKQSWYFIDPSARVRRGCGHAKWRLKSWQHALSDQPNPRNQQESQVIPLRSVPRRTSRRITFAANPRARSYFARLMVRTISSSSDLPSHTWIR